MDYYNVRLGRINQFTGPNTYPFPTRKSALKFASSQAQLYPGLVIIVREPTGGVIKRFGKRRSLKRKAAA